jgi:hypothetical protein
MRAWAQRAAFVNSGGTPLGLGSASETSQQLLNLPIQRIATTQPFSIGGSRHGTVTLRASKRLQAATRVSVRVRSGRTVGRATVRTGRSVGVTLG